MTPFSPSFAHDLSHLASAAYIPHPQALPFTDDELGHLGNISADDENVVVAYRGSRVPRTATSLADLAVLDDWFKVNFQFAQTPALGGRVHSGFWRRSNLTWPTILGWVRQHRQGRRLWVTGHSMGGALAILAGQRFVEAGILPAGVYAFGAPMVGDEKFRETYAAPLHCIEHRHDIIPHLPFGGWLLKFLPKPVREAFRSWTDEGYASVGEVHWITPNEELVPYSGSLLERGLRGGLLLANTGQWVPDHWVEQHTGFLTRLMRG